MRSRTILFSSLVFLILVLASCAPQGVTPPEVESESVTDDQSVLPGETPAIEESSIDLSAEPQGVLFQSLDGTELQGVYYPPAGTNAPLIILFHWAQGDQSDWTEIAYWLQNRGRLGSAENPDGQPWLDASWFPEMSLDRSFGVFTFTFRNCEGGCQAFDRDGWLLDAQAAAEFARSLENVNADRMVFIGASIGADGAADGCLYLNSNAPGACRGALSLSPGSYLTEAYPEVVMDLIKVEPSIPAWCLYSEDDPESFEVCDGITSGNYRSVMYESGEVPGFPHGMMLIQPEVEPNPLNIILDFLAEVIE